MLYDTFKNTFESKDFFENWKKNNNSSKIIFNNLSPNKIVDGILLLKNPRAKFVNFRISKQTLSIHIKTNDLSLLDDLYNYCNDINSKLSKEQFLLSKRELKKANEVFSKQQFLLSESELKKNNLVPYFIFKYIHYTNQFNNGLDLFNIDRPTAPLHTSFTMPLKIAFYVVIGGILGFFFIIFKDAFRNYKKN